MKKTGKGVLSALTQDGERDFMPFSEGVQTHVIETNVVVD